MTSRASKSATASASGNIETEKRDLINRFRRVQGQIGGLVNMIEEERDCTDIVHQIAATKKALERAGILLLTSALTECIADNKKTSEVRRVELQKAFMSLS
jgi:DNA-binding FrmR family transcriptional regulator